MKQTLLVFSLVGLLAACGSGSSNAIPEMKDFMGQLKGNAASVKGAFAKYAADGVDTSAISMFNLSEPAIVSETKEGEAVCYTMSAKAGMTERKADLCWTGGKITKATDLGITSGVIR